MPYHHLRTRSEYSLLTSALKLADLEEYIKEHGVKAMCLMDDMSLSAGLRWSMHLGDMHSIKPLIGLNVFIGKSIYNLDAVYPQLGLIAQSEKGYLNLLKILQCGHFNHNENDFQQLWLTLDELKEHTEDVILLTGGYRGVIGYEFLNYGQKMATETLDELHKAFGDRMYIELTRHGRTKEKELEDFLIDYAYKNNVALVATNDPCFLKREHFKAFDALACIRDKQYLSDPTRKRLNEEYYLKSAEEMEELFSDIPEAIENTEQIVKRCNFLIHKVKPTLPHFCKNPEEEAEMMKKMSYDGMEERFTQIKWQENGKTKNGHTKEEYFERLDYEIGVITKMGFPGYFLIVADFVQWSKHNGVSVGCGRGSGAGSLVAWCLKITEVDPLEYGLFFERFLNPERVSMPDFDIDFCQENRWKTIEYVMNKYGKDSVSRIITYGKMKAKMVMRDVGRVLQISFDEINNLLKLIPNSSATDEITIEKALEMVPRLKEESENNPKVGKMIQIALDLENLNRNTSMHAAGVVIGYKPLIEIGPVCSEEDDNIEVGGDENEDGSQIKSVNRAEEELDENGNVVKKSHHKEEKKLTGISSIDWFNSKPENRIAVFGYDMKDCEKIGLVKFDFLGLQTLTVLSKCCEMIKQNYGIEIDVDRIPTDDEKTYKLLASGHLKGVFQFETPLPRNALKAIKTDNISDMAVINALNRPGPMENMPAFIKRKMGEEKFEYYHPILEPILKETYGIIIYQEQVMEVAKLIAGYSLGEADMLRRAMGKKILAEMERNKTIFCERAEKLGLVSKDEAKHLFEIIEKFAGYGFNKAHAVSYAIIAYQTAYLKANYPVEFMASLMNLDINKTDKLNGFVSECQNMGIEIIPPDVNTSTAEFSCRDGKVVYALGAIKGMGTVFAKEIVRIREEGGKFKDLQDFFTRLGRGLENQALFSKKTIESLAKSGALNCFGLTTRTILENEQPLIEVAQEWAKRSRENNTASVINMFGADDSVPMIPKLKQYPEYNIDKLSALEFEIFGFYMKTHPLNAYKDRLEEYKFEEGADVLATTYKNETRLLMSGVITAIKIRFRNKKKFAFVNLLDLGGVYETIIFNDELINQKVDVLVEGKKVALEVEARTNPETGTRLQIKDCYLLDDFFTTFPNAKDVKLGLNKKNKQSANNYQNQPSNNNKSGQTNSKSQWYKDENGKWRKKEDVNGAGDVGKSSQNIQTQQQANQQLNSNSKTSGQQVDNSIGIPNGSRRIIHPTPTPYPSTARSARGVSLSSPTYHGILSKSLTPSNSTTIQVEDINQLSKIKQDIQDRKYKEFDNVILKINDNELVIKIKN